MVSRLPTPLEYGRRSSDAVRAQGGSAFDAALAHIDATFSAYGAIWQHKQTVRSILRRGPLDTDTRMLFGWFFAWVVEERQSLNSALARLDGIAARGLKQPLIHGRPHWRGDKSISLSTVATLRLALRWIRRHRLHKWAGIVAAMLTPVGHPSEILDAAE